jgi:hypothetical protein
MALGREVGSLSGKVTGTRVLPPEGGRPRVEVSFDAAGDLLGVPAQVTCTYWVEVRPDGTIYGETNNQGVIVTDDGVGTYSGAGTGHMTPGGGSSLRGAIYLHNAPSKLSELSEVAVVFEWEVDGEGNTKGQLHEWK